MEYESLIASSSRVLDEVDGALARLADHTYGTCETCGDAIDGERLVRQPAARRCERHLGLVDQDGR